MTTLLRVWPWLLLLGVVPAASADEVTLKNGSKLEGAVQEDGNTVTVDVGSGIVTLNRSDIKSINRPNELVQDYDRRYQAIKPDDVNGYYQLYLWTRQQEGMKARGERLLRKILEVDPNHEQTRRALGYVNHKGAWLTQDEYKGALGLVRYNGDWVTVDAAERLRRMDQELALAASKQAAESDKLRTQLQMERDRISLRRLILSMISAGELPNFQNSVGTPWGLRYWGPAAAAGQPTAD
jgi:hypothetical protein